MEEIPMNELEEFAELNTCCNCPNFTTDQHLRIAAAGIANGNEGFDLGVANDIYLWLKTGELPK